MRQLAKNSVLLCGAGVSQGSGLPDGQALARVAFDLVWAGSNAYPPAAASAVHDALRWPNDGEPQLRLELVLDLMSRHVPAEVMAGVYSLVLGAEPCLAHYVVVAAGFPVVTTNQDELIERAAVLLCTDVDVLHLHGLGSKPESIITMLSQYAKGLPIRTAEEMRHRIGGSHLVVLGYSGRDLDVMPYLYGAARMTWLHYQPGGGAPPATEVRALQAALGNRMRVIACPDPTQWLFDRLPSAARLAVIGVPETSGTTTNISRPAGLTGKPLAAFRGLKLIERRLAVARVLLHIGQPEMVRAGLLRVARSHPHDPRTHLMIADALVMLQERSAALRRYAQAAAMTTDPRIRSSALLGSAHTRANGADYHAAVRDLGEARRFAREIPDAPSRHNREAWITALQARIYAMTDDEDSAMRLYHQVATLAGRTRDIDLRVNSLIFGSDLLHNRGRYHEALARLTLVFEDNELYGRPYTRVWGHFYRGEVLCAMGRVSEGLADLESCRDNARLNMNRQAEAWASLALASYLRCQDLDAAQRAITACEAAMTAYGRDMLLCDVRLAWERAELSRAYGQDEQALHQIAVLRQRLNASSFPVKLPYMIPHMLAVEGEIARHRGDITARAILAEARHLYAQAKWDHYVARMDVSLWLMTGRSDPPAALLRRCISRSYAAEIGYLTAPHSGYIPLHGL
jgi:tetratricopeptide (TPR) repeat protein